LADDSSKKTEKQPETSSSIKEEKNAGGTSESKDSSGGIVSDLKKFATVESEAKESSKTQNTDGAEKNKDHSPSGTEKKKKIETDGQSFPIPEIPGKSVLDALKSRKDQIIRYSAAVVGAIFIVYGLVLISASVTKVADNVIFGEGASFAAFSILLGILIIVAAFSQSILNRSFLKNINSELKIAEGRSDDEKKKFEEDNGNKDNKKGKDNKDNIVGENKK
jgi:hypothetical protein